MNSGQFAGIFTRSAKLMADAGLDTTEKQLEWASAFSKFYPNDPSLAANSLAQMATLPLRKNEFMADLLKAEGYDPKSYNVEDLQGAISKRLRRSFAKGRNEGTKDLQKVAAGTGVPLKSLRPLQMSTDAVWQEQLLAARQQISEATWDKHMVARFEKFTGTPWADIRKREAGAELPSLAPIKPGSLRWSANVLENMRAGIRQGTPGYDELKMRKAREWNAD